jgi:hypothetical protein
MTRPTSLVLILGLLLAAFAGWWMWKSAQDANTEAPAVPSAAAPASAPASAPAAASSGPAYPILADADKAPLTQDQIAGALDALLGRKSAATFVLPDEFPRRVVATTDNLGRAHAPAILWPTPPMPGRFTTETVDGVPVISPDNASRYTPFVLFVETLNVKQVVDFYVRMYPLLQEAYSQLGFPRQNFNDRVIAVIDSLLAAPEPEGPIRLHLMEVKGPIASERPWVRYEFEDPALQALPAGQKIMVRIGAVNERRLKRRLTEFRDEIVARGQKR